MKRLSLICGRLLCLLILTASFLPASAVSNAEMEQAKAIAAKFYIRFVNDGAGYLDNWLPANMKDLEGKLANDKDRESFRQFQNASVAKDYASWDKARLTAYWSGEFFTDNASKLNEKGAANGLCKSQIKKAVEAMEVAPAAAPEAAPEVSGTPDNDALADEATAAAVEENLDRVAAEIDDAQALVDRESEEPAKGGSKSGTWVYVLILAILVGVVIFLVVYASRAMKGEPRKEEEPENREPEPGEPMRTTVITEPVRSLSDETKMREKFAETLAMKSEEIRNINRKLSDATEQVESLKEENQRLREEIERLRNKKYEQRRDDRSSRSETSERAYAPAARENEGDRRRDRDGGDYEIYLGRVNSKGIFVRADRHAVEGQSIYKLVTRDGIIGKYTLIHNPIVEEQVLDDPGRWLAGGCFAKDIFDTNGREEVITEHPGTAVFSDGAWRVERKAKIRYL